LLKSLRKRMQDDKGFTLIELMVVVLIIAILIAIAIPTFLGLRTRAQDRAAQSDLRNALTAAKAIYTDDEAYTNASDTVAMDAVEPSLDFTNGASVAPTYQVSIDSTDTEFAAARLSASGECFWIHEVATNPGAGTFYGVGGACTGVAAMAAADPEW
jgi:type IV pilus assembly protein PilA